MARREAVVQQRALYTCTEPFTVWKNGIPETYSQGRQVFEGDEILRTHGAAFRPSAALVEQATYGPGELRPVHIPNEVRNIPTPPPIPTPPALEEDPDHVE